MKSLYSDDFLQLRLADIGVMDVVCSSVCHATMLQETHASSVAIDDPTHAADAAAVAAAVFGFAALALVHV